MKNIFKLLLLSPMAFTNISCGGNPSKPVDVVLISGQSNAVGCTHVDCIGRSIGYDEYDEYMAGYPEIQIAYECWDKATDPATGQTGFYAQNKRQDGDFFKVMLGQGNTEAAFGPEIGIAEAMHTKYANKLFLIKYACGSSNLKDDWAKRTSPMYNRFVNFVKKQMKNLKSKGYKPTIKAMCWMQGEGDSYPRYFENDEYYNNLVGFVGNLRQDLKELAGNKDFPFIDAGINATSASPWDVKGATAVNNSKKKFANDSELNTYIDTIAAGLHTNKEPYGTNSDGTSKADTAHYDTESQIQLGHLFAEAFEKYLDPVEEQQ